MLSTWDARHIAVVFYLLGGLTFSAALNLHAESAPRGTFAGPVERAHALGEIDGVPVLDPKDGMANAAALSELLAAVPPPGRLGPGGESCNASPRLFALLTGGRLSRVRFNARQVCQLRALKRASMVQPGFGHRGLAEVAAFVLGKRVPGGDDVDVSRIVVPPFRFSGEWIAFLPADLGPLQPGEQFIGTYHTHPEGELEQGIPSDTDLRFMMVGRVDFHGRPAGRLRGAKAEDGVDWLFDIVEPRDGDWNVYAHDQARLEEIATTCDEGRSCPLDQLRLTGSRYYLLTKFYEEKDAG